MKLQYFLLTVLNVLVNSDPLIDSYVNLITNEIARANNFTLPTDASSFQTDNSIPEVYGVYDYIVVGAGSAGAVVASRLSESPKTRVLLLEAGGYESEFSDIPGIDLFLRRLEFNWNYRTTPQTKGCLANINNQCPYPRGKGLGGSSIIYTLVNTRGNKADYDCWCEQGNPGWCYKDVLPLFIKSENFQIHGDAGYHGTGGNINVEYAEPESPQLKAFIEGNLELGRKVVDYNGKEQLGVSKIQFDTIYGRRDSTGNAYLNIAKDRANLDILPYSLVTKILITELTKIAYGVLFSRFGTLYAAIAEREVILSAGVIGSPQLLMLSGIGAEWHLRELGIPVIQPLPVGENFNEQAAYLELYFSTNYSVPILPLKEDVEEYLNGYGRLTKASNVEGLGFFQTKSEKTPGRPNIEIVIVPSFNTNGTVPQPSSFRQEYLEVLRTIDLTHSFRLVVTFLRPKSRGVVRLRSKSPYDYPLIDLNLFSDIKNEDIATLYDGIQIAIEMTKTWAFQKLNTTLLDSSYPTCRQYKYLSRAYWYCQLRQLGTHISHAVGTNKMGPDPAEGAVVDHELKVYGIRNLRVADASIMPEVVSAHTHIPSVMIGEKLSEILQAENFFEYLNVLYEANKK